MMLKYFYPIIFVGVKAEEPTTRKFNSLMSMAYSQSTTGLSKEDFSSRLNNYGCHCFINGAKNPGGHGHPVNEIDEACRDLYRCRKCIEIEYQVDNDFIVDGRYTWGIDKPNTLNCRKNAKNKARKALCECDRHFAITIGDVWTDLFYDFSFWRDDKNMKENQTFNYDKRCRAVGNGVMSSSAASSATSGAINWGSNSPQSPSPIISKPQAIPSSHVDKCCGSGFPYMQPFDSAQKSCCGSTLFSTFSQECCEGKVVGMGSC